MPNPMNTSPCIVVEHIIFPSWYQTAMQFSMSLGEFCFLRSGKPFWHWPWRGLYSIYQLNMYGFTDLRYGMDSSGWRTRSEIHWFPVVLLSKDGLHPKKHATRHLHNQPRPLSCTPEATEIRSDHQQITGKSSSGIDFAPSNLFWTLFLILNDWNSFFSLYWERKYTIFKSYRRWNTGISNQHQGVMKCQKRPMHLFMSTIIAVKTIVLPCCFYWSASMVKYPLLSGCAWGQYALRLVRGTISGMKRSLSRLSSVYCH